MEFKKVFVTGDIQDIYRHHSLFEEMSSYFERLDVYSRNDSARIKMAAFYNRVNYAFSPNRSSQSVSFHKSKQAFLMKSKQIERKIRQMKFTPDLVFQVYAMYSPFWDKFDIPYIIFLDYTMSLAERVWSSWAPFVDYRERNAWMDLERRNYERAHHLLVVSNLVKSSLVADYGMANKKISVVGVSGNFKEPYEGPKSFGSKQILFNGSDFARKGGDLVLAAFKKVQKVIPEAKLVIVGKNLYINDVGVESLGKISSRSDMFNLFLRTDLVVAPARCDPFPLFLIEAMNYGIPCIVSANDGMPEMVDNEVNGIVINQPTPDILANQIVQLLSNPSVLTSMSKEARQKVKTKFNWNTVNKNILQALLP